ncbi:unnamed protein product [Umbelopsis ramanniana]
MDSHTLLNDAQPLSDDMKTLQQLMSITLKDGASQFTARQPFTFRRRHPANGQIIQVLVTSELVKPLYYNHGYDSALVIDSILLGGSDYYTLSRDYLGNFVIDIEIDETLVQRSPTDDSDDNASMMLPEQRISESKSNKLKLWERAFDHMGIVEVQVLNTEQVSLSYRERKLSDKATFLSPRALQRLFYDIKHDDYQGMVTHLQAIELNASTTGVNINLDRSFLNGKNLLMHAASCNAHQVICYLIEEKGMDINFQLNPRTNGWVRPVIRSDTAFADLLGAKRAIVVLLHIKKLKLDVTCDDFDSLPKHPSYNYYAALHLAVEQGNTQAVEVLLQHNAKLENYHQIGFTPFMIACINGEIESLKMLLKYGQKVITLEGGRSDPLHRAVHKENTELLELLLEHGADIDHVRDGLTPLSQAVFYGSKKMVLLLLDKGADIHFCAEFMNGWKTAVCIAVGKNDFEMVKLLLDNGANVDPTRHGYDSPLEMAIEFDVVPMVKLLIERGATLTKIKGQNRSPPLVLAAQLASTSMVSLLLDSGCDIEEKDFDNMNALYFAVIRGSGDMVDLLVARGANVNAKVNVDASDPDSCEEWTILMAAIKERKSFDVVSALLRWGADITEKDLQGRTALHMTCYRSGQEYDDLMEKPWDDFDDSSRFYDFLKVIVDSGADVNDRDNQGRTVFHYRVTSRTPFSPAESARYLLAKGADPELKDIYGRNVFHYAANRGHVDVLTILHAVMKDPKAVDNYGMNALHFAAWRGNFAAVTYLISQGFAMDEVDYSGVSTIHLTAMSSPGGEVYFRHVYPPQGPIYPNGATPPVVNGYLPDGYTNLIDATDHLGRFPIHFAMMAHTPHMAKVLLALGASAIATDNEGNNAAHYAYANDHEGYLPVLKGYGLYIHGWNHRMQSPSRMRQKSHTSRGTDILDQSPKTDLIVDVHAEDSKKRTPLLLACSAGCHHDYIDALLKKGANPKTLDIDGMNAIHHYGTSRDIVDFDRFKFDRPTIDIFRHKRNMHSFKANDSEALASLKLLMDAGTDINAQDNNGDTPLHQATEKKLSVKVQTLLQLGAKTDIKNNNGKTAKDIADKNNLKNLLRTFNLYCGTV